MNGSILALSLRVVVVSVVLLPIECGVFIGHSILFSELVECQMTWCFFASLRLIACQFSLMPSKWQLSQIEMSADRWELSTTLYSGNCSDIVNSKVSPTYSTLLDVKPGRNLLPNGNLVSFKESSHVNRVLLFVNFNSFVPFDLTIYVFDCIVVSLVFLFCLNWLFCTRYTHVWINVLL